MKLLPNPMVRTINELCVFEADFTLKCSPEDKENPIDESVPLLSILLLVLY